MAVFSKEICILSNFFMERSQSILRSLICLPTDSMVFLSAVASSWSCLVICRKWLCELVGGWRGVDSPVSRTGVCWLRWRGVRSCSCWCILSMLMS